MHFETWTEHCRDFAAFGTHGTRVRPFNALDPQSSSALGKGLWSPQNTEQFPSISFGGWFSFLPCHLCLGAWLAKQLLKQPVGAQKGNLYCLTKMDLQECFDGWNVTDAFKRLWGSLVLVSYAKHLLTDLSFIFSHLPLGCKSYKEKAHSKATFLWLSTFLKPMKRLHPALVGCTSCTLWQ